MARTAASASGDDPEQPPKPSKRRCVPSACVPCRKRKSKCDGGTPVCATCTAVYKTDCFYDEASETRRGKASSSKRGTPSSQGDSNEHADFLVKALRSLPESEVADLVKDIRNPHSDIASTVDTWRRTATLPFSPRSERPSFETDLSVIMGKPSLTKTGESRHFGHTSSLGLVPEDEDYNARPQMRSHSVIDYNNGTWTSVTNDAQFVQDLLDLYFKWSHSFYVIFSKECFYRDFRSGRRKYCSPLLVNAILAYACHFSDDPRARLDPDNPRSAGDHFFAEARRLLYEDETPSLTQTQALCVMALREPSAGRDSSGFLYIGRCMRMAVELGMHLDTTSSPDLKLTPSEIEVRKVTFWGCFIVDSVWTLCVGRIAQLPKAAITIEKPALEEPAYDPQPNTYQVATPAATSKMFLQEFATLAELINDNNLMFFAPRERLTSRRLLAMYKRYQEWYRNLPPPLHLPQNPDARPMAHILVLHMLYCTCIIHLFRPMLKLEIMDSDVSPREICIEMANQVSEHLRTYRRSYDLRACTLVLTHIFLSVSIIHLVFHRNSKSSTYFVESLQALEDMSVCHYFGARSFKIVHSIAKTWNLPWPEELKLSKLVPKSDASLESGESLFHVTRSAPDPQEGTSKGHANSQRRESLSMFSPGYASSGVHSIPTASMQASPSFAEHFQPAPNTMPLSMGAASTSEHADTLFWTPAPGFGLPIFPREFNTGPMDLNNMLASASEWDRFSRDGFKMSEAWPAHDPGLGFANPSADVNVGMSGPLIAHQANAEADSSGYGSTTSPATGYGSSTATTGVEDHSIAPTGPGYQTWGWNGAEAPGGNSMGGADVR